MKLRKWADQPHARTGVGVSEGIQFTDAIFAFLVRIAVDAAEFTKSSAVEIGIENGPGSALKM